MVLGCILKSYMVPFTKNQNKREYLSTFVWLLCDDATNAKGLGCDEGTNLR